MEIDAPDKYGSTRIKTHTLKFDTEKDRDLFVKHIEAKKNALKLEILKTEVQQKQQQREQKQQQERVQQRQQKKYDTIEIVVPVKNTDGSIGSEKVSIPVIECHQYGLSRNFSSNVDLCGVYRNYFVRGSNKLSLQGRFNDLLTHGGNTNIEECSNHCFDIKNCTIVKYVRQTNTNSERVEGYNFGLTIIDTTKESGNPFLFLFKDRDDRDFLLFKLTDIKIKLTPSMPYDDRKKTTDLFLRCRILMSDVICAFTPSQIIWGTDLEKLYSRLKLSESGLDNETGRFITFSDIADRKSLSNLKYEITLKNGDTTTFTFNDEKTNEKFQVKLRRNLGLVQNYQKSIAQITASESVTSDLDSFTPVKRPKSFFDILGFGGGTTLTKTKHKSNHKAKAKTQSKPKHKNKPKPKHRTKAKTIKKNKRAHHKFDKKYTRKH